MKAFLVLLITGISLTAQAAKNTKFSCANVGGTAEWTVYIDLEKKLAGFFDNDSTVTIPLVGVLSLESMPPQTEYTFRGRDRANGGRSIMEIVFNATKKSAWVTFDVGTRMADTKQSLDGCVVDNQIDL